MWIIITHKVHLIIQSIVKMNKTYYLQIQIIYLPLFHSKMSFKL